MNIHDVTLIVPVRNERHNIGAFLRSLPEAAQIIVIDASDDDTPSLIRAIRPDNTRLIERKCNIAQARQLGADIAHTPWLLFTDADVIFSLTYFAELERLNAQAKLGVIYGAKKATDRFETYHTWFERGQRAFAKLGIPAATGSNMLISQRAFRASGGFDVRLPCNEDSELAWRVRRAGFKSEFAPQLVVYARDHRRLERGIGKR